MLPVLNLGPLAIQVPGLIWLIGLWLGLSLAERHAADRGINPNRLYNLVFAALIAGIIGARLSYVVRYPAVFASDPLSILSLNPGLLDPLGGLAAALLVGLIYGQRKSLPLWETLDGLTPMIAVLFTAYGLANLASGSAFGSPSNLPWAIDLWGAKRHPTQIYQSLAAGLILFAIWPGKGLIRPQIPGVSFLIFTALGSASHLFLEAFRADSSLMMGGIRTEQVIAWGILALSLWGIGRRRMRIANSQHPDESQTSTVHIQGNESLPTKKVG